MGIGKDNKSGRGGYFRLHAQGMLPGGGDTSLDLNEVTSRCSPNVSCSPHLPNPNMLLLFSLNASPTQNSKVSSLIKVPTS